MYLFKRRETEVLNSDGIDSTVRVEVSDARSIHFSNHRLSSNHRDQRDNPTKIRT